MSYSTTSDHIDSHARQAWALAELLVDHYGGQEDHNVLNDDIMSGLMENLAYHTAKIQEINAGSGGDHAG
ncbi:hypothetical protein ACGTN6_00925 [Halomonas sp. THAF12]|uniref:hypothetical protein n=1 Tax=Halomonas sp. B23F22_10 TaxID=3459515 RepID=UPI00373E0E63